MTACWAVWTVLGVVLVVPSLSAQDSRAPITVAAKFDDLDGGLMLIPVVINDHAFRDTRF